MSLLWWQNGRDIDWFSANLEKWIKPGATSSYQKRSQDCSGRYSKLKSCRLSKTCQTMMYIPQEPQSRDYSYEEQLARFQDNRTYRYSQRQEHYNSHYNYIRTSARRAYYKPESNEIVLADEYDKVQTIQRQNRAKNYDYLLLLQQFLKHQETKTNHTATGEDIRTMTTYLNNNIEQYEQTDQTITLKQFLQEGIKKYEHENLMTLKEFLQENTDKVMNQNNHNAQRNVIENERTNQHGKESEVSNENLKGNDSKKEITLQEFLENGCEGNNNNMSIFSSTNLFANQISKNGKSNNPIITITSEENSGKNTTSANDISFEEFLKERQTASCRNGNNSCNIQETNDASPRPLHQKDILDMEITELPLSAETRTPCVDSNDKISFDDFLKERRHHLSPNKSASEEDKEISLEEFLKSEAILDSDVGGLGKSNEHTAKVKSINLKLSKSFNDRTNLLKENLIKKLTRNEIPNRNDKKEDHTEEISKENKITLYEFLKEEEQKQTTELEHGFKNLQLRTKYDSGDTFYEINNNTPDIKLNDNFIQVETKTPPSMKYSQYEHNKQVCACDNPMVLAGRVYNQNYNQLLNNTAIYSAEIEFIDRSYDSHRNVHQNNIVNNSFSLRHGANTKLYNSVQTHSRKCKSRTKPYISPVGGIIENGMYGPVWPSVLLTYDKVVSPNRQMYLNESYA